MSAFTPPNDSDTFSTASRTSPAGVAARRGALMRAILQAAAAAARRRMVFTSTDLARRAVDRALAAVLERHLGRDVGLLRAVVERLDQRAVALGDEAAAHLLGAGQLAVVGVELLVQDQEAADLRARHAGSSASARFTSSTCFAIMS